MVNPKGTPDSLGVTPLSSGEYSRPIRVRAPSWVFGELTQYSPAEIGEFLQTALRGLKVPLVAAEPNQLSPMTPPNALRVTTAPSREPRLQLSSTLLSIVDSLKRGSAAEYDHRERKWMICDRSGSYAVFKRDLDKLVKAGLIYQKNNRYLAN